MPKKEQTAILQHSDSTTEARDRLVREWLAIYGENYRQDVSEAQARIYTRFLSDLSMEQLRAGFERALQECRFFPNIADIRACVGKPVEESKALAAAEVDLEAEKAWKWLEKRRDEWGEPLTPLFQNGKTLYAPAPEEATEHALQAIGGWHRFCNYETDRYGLMRRDFLEAYRTFKQTDGFKRIGAGEARGLVGQVLTQHQRQLKGAK